MSRTYRSYSDEDVRTAAASVKSMRQLLKKLGLKEAGGNYMHMRSTLQKLNIDISHWTGQLWSKGQSLKDFSKYSAKVSIRRRLLKERGHQCQECKLTSWNNKPIPLELEHIDGNNTNQEENNLLLLCCNCHALTPTWRRSRS